MRADREVIGRAASGRASSPAKCTVFVASLLVLASSAHSATPPVEEDYTLHCSACHGPAGAGVRDRVPSLFATGELAARPGGRDYLMRVPGAAQSPLDDARLARLLNWVVLHFGGVETTPPITADGVGEARQKPLRDPAAARLSVMVNGPAEAVEGDAP